MFHESLLTIEIGFLKIASQDIHSILSAYKDNDTTLCVYATKSVDTHTHTHMIFCPQTTLTNTEPGQVSNQPIPFHFILIKHLHNLRNVFVGLTCGADIDTYRVYSDTASQKLDAFLKRCAEEQS